MLKNIDFNRLNIFYYIYSLKSLVRAAETLHLTPSAISQQLAKLEKELGVQLFIRQHKKLVPTAEAGVLVERLEPFIVGLEEDLKGFHGAKSEVGGHLRIGSPTEFGISHFPEMIASFQRAHPEVTFSVYLKNNASMLSMLRAGELDFGVADVFSTRQTSDRDLRPFAVEPLVDEYFQLVCSKNYFETHLAGQKMSYDLLSKQRFIAYDHGFRNLRAWFDHHYKRSLPRLFSALTIDSVQAVVAAVQNDIGLGVVTNHSVEKAIATGDVVVIETGREDIVNTISLLQIQDKIPSFTEKRFLAHIRYFWQK